MIDPKTKLTVLHDDNTVFTDHTPKAADYLRDSFDVQLTATEDYLYVGFRKSFGAVYVELETANVNANTMTAEIYVEDTASWEEVEIDDETMGLTRSGFIYWDQELMYEVEVNSITEQFIRFKPSTDHTNTTVRGINLVFSDDNMLKSEFFEVDNANIYPPGETSHISVHVAARNQILQRLRNKGVLKNDGVNRETNIDQWDLLKIFEVRQAATYLALSKIFFNLSDNIDDHWWSKYVEYTNRFKEMMRLSITTLDDNDDGKVDVNEDDKPARVQRWNR